MTVETLIGNNKIGFKNKMNRINKNICLKWSMGFMAILMLTFSSCQKDTDAGTGTGDGGVYVNLNGVSFEEDDIDFEKKGSTNSTLASGIVKDTTLIFDDFVVDVQMTKESNRAGKIVSNKTVLKGSNENMAATTVTNSLTPGVKYRVVVFNSDGSYYRYKDYVYGPKKDQDSIALDHGKKYSFVVYSINSSTETLPAITFTNGIKNFANAKLVDVSKDLMTFIVKDMEVSFGKDNNLNVILKHRFSMITTKLKMDSKMTGSITKLDNTTIGNVDASATYNFVDGTLTYKNNQSTKTLVVWPNLTVGLREVISYPTLLINPQASNKTLTFGTITIDDETKSAWSIANIKVLPGCKYNLNLNFRTCTEEVKLNEDALTWRYKETSDRKGCYDPVTNKTWKNGELLVKEFNAPASNYGFTFDVTELDNAINMEVNGKQIFTDSKEGQIQFQTYDNTANGEGIITRNIKFIDGDEYGLDRSKVGGTKVGDIWTLIGSPDKPLIRINISKTGKVTMMGSKTSGGPLVQIISKGTTGVFNDVTWNTNTVNTVKVTQKVSNTTFVVGRGYGQRKIACPTT
jgi:hypothetical protein